MSATAVPDKAHSGCTNCAATLPVPRPPYCPQCGQESDVHAPTVGEFLQQFGGAYLSTEGALWRTLKRLLLKPGELTLQYRAGRRRYFVLPLRLYLTISVAVLLAAQALVHLKIGDAPPFAIDLQHSELVVLDLGFARAGIDRGRFYCENLPASTCQRLQRRLNADPQALWQDLATVGQRFVGQVGTAMFLLVPVFALLTQAAFWQRRWRYAEHLVFALHLHAFWFLAIGLVATGLPGLVTVGWVAIPVYALLAARRVFAGRWWTLLLRLLLVTLAYALLLGTGLILLAIWAILA